MTGPLFVIAQWKTSFAGLRHLGNQDFHVLRCKTPPKQSSAKLSQRRYLCINRLSKLIRHIDTGCLWCVLVAYWYYLPLKTWPKNIFEKLDLRGKSVCKIINKAGYGRWRMGNSFMQSLTLKHFLAVKYPH